MPAGRYPWWFVRPNLNNIVEQDHRAVKRITKPMLGFKSFQSAKNILAGIELVHMIRKVMILEQMQYTSLQG